MAPSLNFRCLNQNSTGPRGHLCHLLANMFAPLIDYYIKDLRAKRRAKG